MNRDVWDSMKNGILYLNVLNCLYELYMSTIDNLSAEQIRAGFRTAKDWKDLWPKLGSKKGAHYHKHKLRERCEQLNILSELDAFTYTVTYMNTARLARAHTQKLYDNIRISTYKLRRAMQDAGIEYTVFG